MKIDPIYDCIRTNKSEALDDVANVSLLGECFVCEPRTNFSFEVQCFTVYSKVFVEFFKLSTLPRLAYGPETLEGETGTSF